MQVNGSGKAAEAHLNWLAVVARDEVDTSWDLVERVARELFERRTLNAAEIAACCRQDLLAAFVAAAGASRRRAMTSKIETLPQALRAVLARHQVDGTLPTSARFLFYELVAAGVVSKHATGARRADQGVIDALKSLRDRGEIPWDWIVDETRSLEDYTGYLSIADGVDAYLNAIRIDPWSDPSTGSGAPLILTESRSLAGALRNLAREYAVQIAATNGQVGGFLHTDVTPALGDKARVLYLGDFDLAGDDIEVNTRRVLERNRNRDLDWERLALTREQVALYSLRPVITKSDRRFPRMAERTTRSSPTRRHRCCSSRSCATGSTSCCPRLSRTLPLLKPPSASACGCCSAARRADANGAHKQHFGQR